MIFGQCSSNLAGVVRKVSFVSSYVCSTFNVNCDSGNSVLQISISLIVKLFVFELCFGQFFIGYLEHEVSISGQSMKVVT